MMAFLIIALAVTPLLLAAAFLLGRFLQARQWQERALSPVAQQHFEIFQSGQINEQAVEAVKRRFRAMLERGEDAKVEACLRPGMQFFFQVRALAEIGTEAAGAILERQLSRRLADDQLEQSWYWIDLVGGLRALGREESLPHLLRFAPAALESPLGHFYAAETSCFMTFAGHVRDAESPLGRTALRVLHRSLEGLRFGVQPHFVAEARLGEIIEGMWEHRPEQVSPLVVRVLIEAGRLTRRIPHAHYFFGGESADREAFDWQLSRIVALEGEVENYLRHATEPLRRRLSLADGRELVECLSALDDLHADAGEGLLNLLQRPGEHAALAIEVMRWSRDPRVAQWLCGFVSRHVPQARRARCRPRMTPPRRPSLSAHVPYGAVLHALRGHPSIEAETILLAATRDWDPTFRAAAFGSLGWWEPLCAQEARACLQAGRRDASPMVRQAARAAAARLGERLALTAFRQAIASENTPGVFDAIAVIANEGLTLLWPDIDRLADADNPELALHAREATERLAEQMERR